MDGDDAGLVDYVSAAKRGAKRTKRDKAKPVVASAAASTAESSTAGTAAAAGAGTTGAGAELPPGLSAETFNPSHLRRVLACAFTDSLYQFLSAALVSWPACPTLNEWKRSLDAQIEAAKLSQEASDAFYKLVVTTFHESFKDLYKPIAERRAAAFASVKNPWLAAVDARVRYSVANAELRAAIWAYAVPLARISNLYALFTQLPDTLMSTVIRIGLAMGGAMQRGEIKTDNIDFVKFGEEILKSMSEADLLMLQTTMSSQENLQSLMALVASVMDGGVGGGGAGAGAKVGEQGWLKSFQEMLTTAVAGGPMAGAVAAAKKL